MRNYYKQLLGGFATNALHRFLGAMLVAVLFSLRLSAQDCAQLIQNAEMTVRVEDCGEKADICLPVFLENIANYSITVNGNAYTQTLRGCEYDTVIIYSYYALLGQGESGPYRLQSWVVDGTTFSGNFNNAYALVDSMNHWDPSGNWLINTVTKNIVGGYGDSQYSSMLVEQLQLPGTYATLGYNEGLTALGTSISLAVGENQVVMFEKNRGCSDTLLVTVTCMALPVNDTIQTKENVPVVIKVLNNDGAQELETMSISTMPMNGTAQVNLDYTITYSPKDGFCGEDEFAYEICNNGQCATAKVFVTVKCGDVVVYNGFSPNGDDYNQYFEIQGLQSYPNSSLLVYNSWGNLVFKSDGPYKNNWDGKWKGKDLPTGTYFYVLDLNDAEKTKYSGWVQLHR
jgi:gliding motility-associated-like protein